MPISYYYPIVYLDRSCDSVYIGGKGGGGGGGGGVKIRTSAFSGVKSRTLRQSATFYPSE